VSIGIEAPPESPGHVGHTPQPQANWGLNLGRLFDQEGGIMGSAIVRALTGRPESAGTLGAEPQQEYAMQPFGIPGRTADRAQPPSPQQELAAHSHTLLSLEEASILFQRSGRVDATVPQQLNDLLDDYRTWKAPR
jgi:hypothetical protein